MRAWVVAGALMAVGGSALAQDEGYARPFWVANPAAKGVTDPWPKDAKGRDRGGKVVVACTLTAKGLFEGCAVESETPAGEGFGAAVLGSARYWRAEPKRVDGRAVASAVRFPIERQLVDSPADWLKQPTRGQFMEYWPTAALRSGADGRAVITCDVSTEGALRKCVVVHESPAGSGFGRAAMGLAGLYRFKPAMLDGKAVVSQVSIPIKFETPGGGKRLGSHVKGAAGFTPVTVLNKPAWVAAPLRVEVEAAYPAKARNAPVRGAATLDCKARADGTIGDCGVLAETPKGLGFGPAAKTLAPRFRLAPAPEGSTLEGARVQVPVQFDPPGAGAGDMGGARVVASPRWTSMPTAEKVEASFPAAARAAGVKEGRATVSCAVQAGGTLGACSVVSETPEGLGFGASALLISGGFAMAPWTEEGKPLDGARIRVPIRYVDAEPAAPEKAAAR